MTGSAAVTSGVALADRLRSETMELHKRAEGHALQQMLVSGRLPRAAYAAHIAQLMLVHRELEEALCEGSARGDAAISAVWQDYQRSSGHIEEDLRVLGVDPGRVRATPATQRLIARIRSAREGRGGSGADAKGCGSAALLGYHYVLEGSKNGAKFIARAIGPAYGLSPQSGLKYLDPYGESQREKWMAFRAGLNAAALGGAEADAAVAAAKDMFSAISEIGDDVLAAAG